MRNEFFWFTVFIIFLGLYFNTDATKELVQGTMVRVADILLLIAQK